MAEYTFDLAFSLLRACEKKNNGRDFGSYASVRSCKKALGSILGLISDVDGSLLKRLSDDKSRITKSEYENIKFLLNDGMKREFGVTRDIVLIGETKSKISLNTILHSLMRLVHCTRTRCGKESDNNKVKCATNKCVSLVIICLTLVADIYTGFPCDKKHRDQCNKGKVGFTTDVKSLIVKLRARQYVMNDVDLENISDKLRMLWSVQVLL
jgi:hypothetical protein